MKSNLIVSKVIEAEHFHEVTDQIPKGFKLEGIEGVKKRNDHVDDTFSGILNIISP